MQRCNGRVRFHSGNLPCAEVSLTHTSSTCTQQREQNITGPSVAHQKQTNIIPMSVLSVLNISPLTHGRARAHTHIQMDHLVPVLPHVITSLCPMLDYPPTPHPPFNIYILQIQQAASDRGHL